jgi:hypothetical protein
VVDFLTNFIGHNLNSAQSTLMLYMGQAQQFRLFYFFCEVGELHGPELRLLIIGPWPFCSTFLLFLVIGHNCQVRVSRSHMPDCSSPLVLLARFHITIGHICQISISQDLPLNK